MRLVLIILLISSSICFAEEVDDLIEDGLLSEAYQYLIDNYKNTPNQPEHLFLKGRTDSSGENSATYLKDFINRLTEDSKLADWARLYLGKYYLTQKLYVTSRKHFQNVAENSPFKSEAEYLAAKCLLLAEEYELASESFKAIVDRYEETGIQDIEKEQAEYYNWSVLGLADALLAEEDYEKAEDIYKRLLQPQFEKDIMAPALIGLTELYEKLQKWDIAQHYMNVYNDHYKADISQVTKSPETERTERYSAKTADFHQDAVLPNKYYIQVGAFSNMNNADRISSLYKDSGYKTHIENFVEGGQEFHRVLIGGYDSKQQAEFIKKRLEKAAKEKYLILKR